MTLNDFIDQKVAQLRNNSPAPKQFSKNDFEWFRSALRECAEKSTVGLAMVKPDMTRALSRAQAIVLAARVSKHLDPTAESLVTDLAKALGKLDGLLAWLGPNDQPHA